MSDLPDAPPAASAPPAPVIAPASEPMQTPMLPAAIERFLKSPVVAVISWLTRKGEVASSPGLVRIRGRQVPCPCGEHVAEGALDSRQPLRRHLPARRRAAVPLRRSPHDSAHHRPCRARPRTRRAPLSPLSRTYRRQLLHEARLSDVSRRKLHHRTHAHAHDIRRRHVRSQPCRASRDEGDARRRPVARQREPQGWRISASPMLDLLPSAFHRVAAAQRPRTAR